MHILIWTLLLLGAASTQIQPNQKRQSDACLCQTAEVQRLTQTFGDKLAVLEENLKKCRVWSMSGLELKKLETGVYLFGRSDRTWKGAVDFCKSKGMHLVVIKSEKEMKLLNSNKHARSWIAASDIGNEPRQFHWTDGRPVDKNWTDNVSDFGAGKASCLYLDGNLTNYWCTQTRYFICELNSEFDACTM